MGDKSADQNHLIDDSGIYQDKRKQTQATVFILYCRLVTLALIGLGLVALIIGNM
ncbi:hypothetical protein [Butyrivibrio sp. MC2021]|uniref:hypothetical protein n=1 Tax=Butyrivibrio sp. MC2021 TaxID=1408306 RepID=UPI000A8E12B9|nr:hypothetical protein [Butyrivibrio sp. MC2021]